MNVLEKILEEIKDNTKIGNMRCESIRIEKVEEIIRSHIDEVTGDDWIPVSERLPEEGKEVLAQFVVRVRNMNNQVYEKTVYIYPLHYEKGTLKSFAVVPNGKVVAWKPLPEPYKVQLRNVNG